MRKSFLFLVFTIPMLNASAQTQAIRDSIVGQYFCNVTFIGNGNTSYYTDTIYPYPDNTDTIAFYIDDGQFCCWTAHEVLTNDSDFISNNVLSQGTFYQPDSLYYYYNCLSPLGCVYLFYCHKISSTTGKIENEFSKTSVTLSPNPTINALNLIFDHELHNLQVQIMNITGKQILDLNFPGNNKVIEINTSTLDNGIYFIMINHKKRTVIYKFVKV